MQAGIIVVTSYEENMRHSAMMADMLFIESQILKASLKVSSRPIDLCLDLAHRSID